MTLTITYIHTFLNFDKTTVLKTQLHGTVAHWQQEATINIFLIHILSLVLQVVLKNRVGVAKVSVSKKIRNKAFFFFENLFEKLLKHLALR